MKILYILLISFVTPSVGATDEGFLLCTYKNGNKQIKMNDTHKIQRHEELLPNGVKQVIVINDPWTLNNFDNYINISKGEHNITYSLDCKKTYNKDSK